MFSKALSSERQDIIITTLIFNENNTLTMTLSSTQHRVRLPLLITYHTVLSQPAKCFLLLLKLKTVETGLLFGFLLLVILLLTVSDTLEVLYKI